jgi:hypothetical protein
MNTIKVQKSIEGNQISTPILISANKGKPFLATNSEKILPFLTTVKLIPTLCLPAFLFNQQAMHAHNINITH